MRAFYKGDTMSNSKTCPVSGGWCWKNPLQVALFLAVLPYAVKSVAWVWTAVAGAAVCAAK
jgi:hypothetical protein